MQHPLIAFVGVILCSLALVRSGSAGVITILTDPYDDTQVVRDVANHPEVKTLRASLSALRERMSKWSRRDLKAMFGENGRNAAGKDAIFVCEPRSIHMSGINYHLRQYATYPLKDGWLDVTYFSEDHPNPMWIQFRIKVDDELPKLDDPAKLKKRLAREQAVLAKMTRQIEDRWAEVTVWEIDLEARDKQQVGIESGNMANKLAALIDLGKAKGWRLEFAAADGDATPSYSWYAGRRLVAEARHHLGYKGEQGTPSRFVFYDLDGRTREDMGYKQLGVICWRRGDHNADGRKIEGGGNVRYDQGTVENDRWRPSTWTWYDKNGEAIRTEWDTNGDGVPDTFLDGDFAKGKEKARPLTVEQSWAVHPERIPESSRVSDPERFRVPIRRIVREGK
jgi:hypothetical protein